MALSGAYQWSNTLTAVSGTGTSYVCEGTFTSNGETYSQILITASNNVTQVFYDDILAYDGSDGWVNDNYRIVDFQDATVQPDSSFETYFLANTSEYLPSMSAPEIELVDDSITIHDASGLAETFYIMVDGSIKNSTTQNNFDLTTLGLSAGTYAITVSASAEGYDMSPASNEVTYTVTEVLPKLNTPVIRLEVELPKLATPEITLETKEGTYQAIEFYINYQYNDNGVLAYKGFELSHVDECEVGAEVPAYEKHSEVGYTVSDWSGLPTVMPDEVVKVYATADLNQYTVTFKSEGKTIGTYTNYYTFPIVYPEDPTKDGYFFAGWDPKHTTIPAENCDIVATFSEVELPKLGTPAIRLETVEEDDDEYFLIGLKTLTGIGDAVREKTGETEQIPVPELEDRVRSISTGIQPSGSIDIAKNGPYDVTEVASVNVNVPQLDTSDATATAGTMLAGSEAYVNGAKVTGTIPSYNGEIRTTEVV